MRDYIVTIFGETYHIEAQDGEFNTVRRLGARAYLRRHPNSSYNITALVYSGKVKVKVANDRRIKTEDFG